MQITEDEVAQAVRDWADITTTRDFGLLWSMEAGAIGFGYRTLTARRRQAFDEATFVKMNEQIFDNFESYRLDLETLQTAVAGDLGLAWGWYTENFREKGHPPERARVRFSMAMSKDESGWKVITFHRDIQPFDPSGAYPRSLTTA